MNIEDLIKRGADIDIYFHHNDNMEDAYTAISPYTKYGKIEKSETSVAKSLKIRTEHMNFTAFYPKQERRIEDYANMPF